MKINFYFFFIFFFTNEEISNESVTDAFNKDQITRAVKTAIGSKQVIFFFYNNIYIYIYI